MRGHGHDGTGAVAHEHVVGDPDGNALVVHRVDGVSTGEDAGLLLRQLGALQIALPRGLFAILLDGGELLLARDFIHEAMFGSEDHVSGSKQRVGPCGEDGDGVWCSRLGCFRGQSRGLHHIKTHMRSLAAADPIPLEQLDAFRPVEAVEFVDEALGIRRDAQHPLAHGATLDGESADFAFAVHDFFIREHGAELRAPVHRRFADVGQAAMVDLLAREALGFEFADRMRLAVVADVGVVELEEDPLRPFEVAGVGGVHLAVPVVGKAERFELLGEVGDVRLRGDAGMRAGFDRILLRGQAKGVPAHRVQHVEAVHLLETADDVRGGVTLRVADVEAVAAGIGEHVEHEVLRLRGIEVGITGVGRAVGLVGLPLALPFRFKLGEREGFALLAGHRGAEEGEERPRFKVHHPKTFRPVRSDRSVRYGRPTRPPAARTA